MAFKQALRAPGTWTVIVVTTGAVLLVLYAWRLPPFRSAVESTDNAYVRGSVTVIAPKIDGYVSDVLVVDYLPVVAGQVLVQLDSRNYVQKLEQARSNLAAQQAVLANAVQSRHSREAALTSTQAQIASARAQHVNALAQLARAQADLRRADPLASDGSLSQREHDQTVAMLKQAEAAVSQTAAGIRQAEAATAVATQELKTVIVNRGALQAAVESAHAAVQLAQIDLDNTQIRAPRDGRLGEVGVKLGQYATPGTQLMALVPQQVWVMANFKEAQTARMAPGQAARLRVDALDGAQLTGRVERIAPATGSEFSVFRPDNAVGNFTKIPQRLTVRIAVDPLEAGTARLRPGMSVEASVDTASGTAGPDSAR
ncbi:multidrug resistance efflux pump [Variovorax boronicumulans]|uniref:HlyD family secretion protein n=1 Tax=Variovorax boronicumulans TaxID=436515 RepID=UPI00278AF33F|nr:HlyD family secretion protein [Variovorax boronicumulans]MDP9995189.1 multidrug resistance efflux pump [Variovorax boronicumulans]MDQ0006479.1 multidrug resistance efflux pump [Variovorax boronicumulans]MDQ0038443.1 multidrug resistance efflux pump [Variovorax boronicumulans]